MSFFDKVCALFTKKVTVADGTFVSPEGLAGKYAAPMAGLVKPISECSDPAYASGTVAPGVVIVPSDNRVFAPAAGVVDTLFHTKHAIVLVLDNGLEVVIHVGLDTVNLDGEGFKAHVEAGDKVQAGQLLLTYDPEVLKARGLSAESPVLITNLDSFGDRYEVEALSGQVQAGQAAFVLSRN